MVRLRSVWRHRAEPVALPPIAQPTLPRRRVPSHLTKAILSRPVLEPPVPIVIPKWTAHNVADWNELLVDAGDGRFDLNEATAALLNCMPAIGITALTQETACDAWCRIAIHQALFGSFVQDRRTGQSFFLTKSGVFRHIGVETEGKQQSFNEFCKSLLGRAQVQEESESLFFVANGKRSLLQVLRGAVAKAGPMRRHDRPSQDLVDTSA